MKAIVVVVMSVLGASTVMATPFSDVTELLNQTSTMQANFKQVTYDNHQKAIQTSTGKMALSRPGKFRWEVLKPVPQLIIANQSKLWIYDPDLQQVTIRALQQAAGESPALLLSHVDNTLENDYTVTELPQNAGLRWFSLKAKQKDNMFGDVELGFNNANLTEMRLQDNLGHKTTVDFKQISANANLPAHLFTFKTPVGVDVIDETKKR